MLRALTSMVPPAPGGPGPGVYVHIPFCSRRCDYCAFATWDDRHHLWERYAAACRRQAASLADGLWAGRGLATSVFFGGGTPSLWPAELLMGVLGAIRDSLGVAPGAEVTVECNPETVSEAKLAAYRRSGVTRLSFGVQSMRAKTLAALGREHDPRMVRRAVTAAGDAGFAHSYSVDLIFGAAGESLRDWQGSLLEVLALDPPPVHISAYALTVEPGTPLARAPDRHPDDDDQADKYARADQVLSEHGFEWYEISNWAQPGHRCRHNLLYWQQGEYLGVGCSAHSHLWSADGGSRRWWNVRTPERYCRLVEAGASPEAAGEWLSAEHRAKEQLMLSLRTCLGVPAATAPAELFERGLLQLEATGGGPSGEGPRAVLTRKGRLLANEVAARLEPAGALPGQRSA
jgi:putative oxygen-independent coproporphyrinogen III oxidase